MGVGFGPRSLCRAVPGSHGDRSLCGGRMSTGGRKCLLEGQQRFRAVERWGRGVCVCVCGRYSSSKRCADCGEDGGQDGDWACGHVCCSFFISEVHWSLRTLCSVWSLLLPLSSSPDMHGAGDHRPESLSWALSGPYQDSEPLGPRGGRS